LRGGGNSEDEGDDEKMRQVLAPPFEGFPALDREHVKYIDKQVLEMDRPDAGELLYTL